MKVKVIGAGSIGNHLAQASRRMGWDVVVTDNDPKALERMRNDIYPKRYGSWDESIQLYPAGKEPRGGYDIIVIGTPPDVHMKIALEALSEKPKLLHIEKPLCTPDLVGVDAFVSVSKKHQETIVVVGYDHAVSEGIETVENLLKQEDFGEVVTLDVEFREHWRGIFVAHPWLSGPWDTYLGFWKRGGGAGGEHSHALHLWMHFANVLGWGGVKESKAFFDIAKDGEHGSEYDRMAAFLLRTETGKIGRVVQDVVTYPVRKWAKLQAEKGFIEWHCGGKPEGDLIRYQVEGKNLVEKVIAKKRPDDFYREVMHYDKLLKGEIKPEDSPLSFEKGLAVMKILKQAHGL